MVLDDSCPQAAFGLDRRTRDRESRYRAYRKRQAARLVRLIPREAIRPLYRRALGEHEGPDEPDDPLGVLIGFCERLLPLPSFQVWSSDLDAYPTEHLRDLDDSAEAPTAADPSTMESRNFQHAGSSWIAHLRSFRDGSVWRGFIAFEESDSGRVHRTATVFRETDPAELRDRFLMFDLPALGAFLRSALP